MAYELKASSCHPLTINYGLENDIYLCGNMYKFSKGVFEKQS